MKRILSILTLILALTFSFTFTSCNKSKSVNPTHSGARIAAVTGGTWKYVSSVDKTGTVGGPYTGKSYQIYKDSINYIDDLVVSRYTVSDISDENSTITWTYNAVTSNWIILYTGKTVDNSKDSLSIKEFSTNPSNYIEKHLIRQ